MLPPKPLQYVFFTFPPTEPPNRGSSDHSSMKDSPKIFSDSLAGIAAVPESKIPVDLKAKGLISVDYIDNDRLKPKITISPEFSEKLAQPWKQAFIVKLVRSNVRYINLRKKAMELWNPRGKVDMINIGHDFHVVKFDNEFDRERVMKEGPWIIQDTYLAVRMWSPDFIASDADLDYMMVWARFPQLPLQYYDEELLMAIGGSFGKAICVDRNSDLANKGCFARVCVEVESEASKVDEFWLNGVAYRIEYDGFLDPASRRGGRFLSVDS